MKVCQIKLKSIVNQLTKYQCRLDGIKQYKGYSSKKFAEPRMIQASELLLQGTGIERSHFYKYLSQLNRYKAYFVDINEDINKVGFINDKTSLFSSAILKTFNDMDTVLYMSRRKENFFVSDVHLKYGEDWIRSVHSYSNDLFLKEFKVIALLWCFMQTSFHNVIREKCCDELKRRCNSLDVQSNLKAAAILFYIKINYEEVLETLATIVQKVGENAKKLSKEEKLLTLYYCGLSRQSTSNMHNLVRYISMGLKSSIPNLSANEVGIIASSNFLTQNTKFTSIHPAIKNYILTNVEHMPTVCLITCAKFAKVGLSNFHLYEIEKVYTFLDILYHKLKNCNQLQFLHVCLFLQQQQYFTPQLLNKLENMVLTSDLTKWRLKDVCYFAGLIGNMHQLFSDPNKLLARLFNELSCKRNYEFVDRFRYQLSFAVDGSSRAGFYSNTSLLYLYDESGRKYFKGYMNSNYTMQHRSILRRLKIDNPDLYDQISNVTRIHDYLAKEKELYQRRQTSKFIENFGKICGEMLGLNRTKHINLLGSLDMELRIKNGKFMAVDEWDDSDGCEKIVVAYVLLIHYLHIVDKDYSIRSVIDGVIASQVRLYLKLGYTVIQADASDFDEPRNYYISLINKIKESCTNQTGNPQHIIFTYNNKFSFL